jgi:hypothetical protein
MLVIKRGTLMPTLVLLAIVACGGCYGYTGTTATCPTDGGTTNWADTAQPFYETYCTRCHSSVYSGPERQGAPGWLDLDTYDAAAASAGATSDGHLGEIWEVMASGQMPTMMWVRPTQAELAEIGEWLACGQPQ